MKEKVFYHIDKKTKSTRMNLLVFLLALNFFLLNRAVSLITFCYYLLNLSLSYYQDDKKWYDNLNNYVDNYSQQQKEISGRLIKFISDSINDENSSVSIAMTMAAQQGHTSISYSEKEYKNYNVDEYIDYINKSLNIKFNPKLNLKLRKNYKDEYSLDISWNKPLIQRLLNF